VAGGQSAVVDTTWQHFVCFVNVRGRLYELDGRKGGPIDHGASDAASLLEAAGVVMRQYMARDPESIRFTMLALAPPPNE
jgi:ubiquitin carboxyl-terminal hydrolase L3